MIFDAGAAIAVFAAAGLWVWRDRNRIHAGKPPPEVRRVQALVFALFGATTSLIPSGSGDS
jgi:uncharacterized iron-regulated membrane protein